MATPNWANETMWTADNLPVLRGRNSDSVDLIYLDPPFNSKHDYAAPIGSKAAGAAFKDTWNLDDIDVAWLNLLETKHPDLNRVIHAAMSDSDKSYLIYMVPRLLEMHRVLKNTGTIYLHCDPTMSHYLKLLMDAIFGRKNFRNEIVWCYTGASNSPRWFPRKHDVILWYCKSKNAPFMRDNVRVPYHPETLARKGRADDSWFVNEKRDEDAVTAMLGKGKVPEDWWPDIPKLTNQRERTGYPTQKPLALLERIIKASSTDGDVVLDPFCGCATACVAAHNLNRQWVGIDISPKAYELVKRRIQDRGGLFYNLVNRTDVPERTDTGKLPKYNSKANRERLYGMQGGDCAGCKTHFEPQHLTVDHIIARSKGGTDHLSNLQLLCHHCNATKGDRGMEYLITKLAG